MRGFLIFLIILFSINPCQSAGFLQKKDYKEKFIQDALSAEKRNNNDSAFHLYEKALFYYKKDKSILESYAGFCEREKYFNKAQELYQRLFVLTKNPRYLLKKDLCSIKNGNLSEAQIQQFTKDRHLTISEQREIDIALIYYFSYKGDWRNTKKICDKVQKQAIDKDLIDICITAAVKTNDKKGIYEYFKRYHELYPQNIEIIKKIISSAKEFDDYATEKKFVCILSALNPADKGIKYQLAGLYQKHGDYQKANKIYENLLASGDNSKYVKDSYAYSLQMSKGTNEKTASKSVPKNVSKYSPKPLTSKELKEKAIYAALSEKNYSKVSSSLDELLKIYPNDTKLLKLRADMAMALGDYPASVVFFEKLKNLNYPFSFKDDKLLAFAYSKTDNYSKAVEVIENLLQKKQNDEELSNLVLEYSMAEKNWDKALVYTNKLLISDPASEKLLKIQGDLYSLNKDFSNALKSYEQLVQNYPKTEYWLALANLYMANQCFAHAQMVLEPLYNSSLNSVEITDVYLNALLAQQKTSQAYSVVKVNHLENTKIGYMIFGDMAMTAKDYECANKNFKNALKLEPQSLILKNKLAQSYRMLDCLDKSAQIFNEVLANDPNNLEAKLGLGSLETDKKNYKNARKIFQCILAENPCYKPAQIAIADSYIANDDDYSALEALRKMPQEEDVKLMIDQTLFEMDSHHPVFKAIPDTIEMNAPKEGVNYNSPINIKRALNGAVNEDRKELEYKKRRNEAITIIPSYSFFIQQLADQFQLYYQKGGINVSQNVDSNKNFFMGYNAIVYSSGGPRHLNNATHEFRAGVQARPAEKFEYRADIGVKVFEYGNGAMLITDSWAQYFFNDKINVKIGAKRNNMEQSYLSAVGAPIDGVFTGRAADNKFYLDLQGKLPHQIYAYARGAYGLITAQNLTTNQYFEGYVGLGKVLYDNPKHKWINTFATDIVSYNSAYQYNLLKIYNNAGDYFGGYFSPSYFNATTLNCKLEGHLNKWPIRYGVKAFGGVQQMMTPDSTMPAWGFSPYLSYEVNDKVSIYAAYNHFNYADIERDLFMVSAVIRGFKRDKK